MKKLIFCLLSAILCGPTVVAETASIEDNEKDYARFMEAISLYDNKEYDEALVILDSLVNIYPKDSSVRYKLGLTFYRLKDYERTAKEMETICKTDSMNPVVYQLWGNALDLQKKPNDAIKIYKKGLEKCPNAGQLYLEIGNVYNLYGYKDEAITYYNYGILQDPGFASNYYRGALHYFDSEDKIWGLIYGETEILLKPNDESRKTDMTEHMLDCYVKCISINGKDRVIGVTMTSETSMFIKDGKDVYFNAPHMIEMCYAVAAGETVWDKELFNPNDFMSVVTLRKRMVEVYYKMLDDYFGENLYLLQFQKKVIDAGHWEAYNYSLFSDVLAYGAEMWSAEHPDAVSNFIEWYNNGNGFELTDGRSVGVLSIYSNLKPFTPEKAVIKAIDIENFLKDVKL